MAQARDPSTGRFVSLGGAEFTIEADTSRFEKAMADVKASAKETYEVVTTTYEVMDRKVQDHTDRMVKAAIEQSQSQRAVRQALAESVSTSAMSPAGIMGGAAAGGGKAFGGGMAMGLLQLGQAVDDVQYGFRAIVNNIPGLVMAFGGGMGVAGAVGIAAVAVNQLINHWDTLTGLFGSTKATLPTLSSDLGELAGQLKEIDKEIEGLTGEKSANKGFLDPVKTKRLEELQNLSGEAKQRIKDDATVSAHGAATTKAAKDLASSVGKGIELMPEGADTLVKLLTQKMSTEDANRIVAGAIRGDRGHADDLIKNLPDVPLVDEFKAGMNADRRKRMEANLEKATAQGVRESDEEEKEKERKEKETNRILTEQGRQIEAQMWADREDEIRQLQDQERGLRESAGDVSKSQTFGGVRAFAEHTMTAGLDQIANKQLDEAKMLNKQIAGMREDLRKQKQQARLG